MNRRDAFRLITAGGAFAAAAPMKSAGLPALKITDVKTILTHLERPLAVASAIHDYLRPFVLGRNPEEIEDIWQSAYVSSYFRSGVTLNNALSGIDGALWDICGKRANLPVYKMLGGKVRAAVPLYTHTSATELPDLEEQVKKAMASGYRHVRVQLAVPGYSGYGVAAKTADEVQKARPRGVASSPGFEPTPYVNNTIKMFDYLRAKIGFEVDLIHDVHERVPPTQALALAKAVEPFRLFYLEDVMAPEDVPWFQTMRAQTSTPLAMGELFVNRNEWLPLVANRWIDFIRCHISAIGGLSAARHAVNMHLDLASTNFGIQEQNLFSHELREVFPGAPEITGGYMYANDKPGLGVDIDEKAAAKWPYQNAGDSRGNDRRLDGTIVRP